MPDDSASETGFRSIGEVAGLLVADMQKDCAPPIGYGRKDAAAEGVGSTRDGLTETLSQEDRRMTADRPTIAESRPKSIGNRGGAL